MAWLNGYSTRRKLTVDATKVDADLENFPVLVKLTSANFDFSKANADGFDVRFTSDDGETPLKYERERHDQDNQVAEYWVKVPAIDDTTNTDIYIYYRTEDTDDGADPTAVWDANHKGVWHLKDITTSTINDSTVNANHGAKKGADEPIQTDGKIAKAQDFDGSNDFINVGDVSNALDAATAFAIEGWAKQDALDVKAGLFAKRTSQFVRVESQTYSDGNLYVLIPDGAQALAGWFDYSTVVTANIWFHWAVVFNGSGAQNADRLKIYINGVSQTLTWLGTIPAVTQDMGANPLIIGEYLSEATYWNGLMDEVRLSTIARLPEWIKASYNSGNDSLLGYGGEETPLVKIGPFPTFFRQ